MPLDAAATLPYRGGMVDGLSADRPLTVSVSVMLEGWSDDAAPSIGPMGNPLKAGVLDLQARSWAEYGPKVGAWRLLDVLARADAHAVFYVSGILAERYPMLMRSIIDAGHVIGAHGWAQEIIPALQTPADEERDLSRCVAAIEGASGRRPVGWLSPRCTPSSRTAERLAAHGFIWHADYFDADEPYTLQTPGGTLLAVPFTMEVNDMPLYVRYGSEPQAFSRIFERIVTESAATGARPFCLDITAHAHVFGRPYGAAEFRATLEIARRYPDRVRLTTHAELAAAFVRREAEGKE
jgi:hypothetical protein